MSPRDRGTEAPYGSAERVVIENPPKIALPRSGLWLTDVTLVVSTQGPHVVGDVLSSHPRRAKSTDWTRVRWNRLPVEEHSGRSLRGAAYLRIVRGSVYIMGPRYGSPATSLRQENPAPEVLPIYNPERRSKIGNMGGINYEAPEPSAISNALERVWEDLPGAVVLDGTDDWFAPEYVRPELFAEWFSIDILALWHTGASGKSTSGIVLEESEYEVLNERYRQAIGYSLEHVPSQKRAKSHSTCGCWDGSAFLVYRDPGSRPGAWSP